MKITNYLTILFSVVAIFALLGLAGFVTYINTDDSDPIKQQVTDVLYQYLPEEVTDMIPLAPASSAVSETEAVPESEVETETVATEQTLAAHDIIFVGDSRTVGMKNAVNDTCAYIGAEGEGYRWFASDGITELRTLLESTPSRKVVFNLGVNDPENIHVYVDLYNSLSSEYEDTPFYYMSVNPLGEKAQFKFVTNEIIEEFNKVLKSEFTEHYLDCYSYLEETGFDTVDELHYTEDTYRKIHRYAVENVA